jgi:hypothetical protein
MAGMNIVKIALYVLTIAGAFFYGFLELRLKRDLQDNYPRQPERVSDMGALSSISMGIKDERLLNSLPSELLDKIRVAARLKFLFITILIIEVLVLQR